MCPSYHAMIRSPNPNFDLREPHGALRPAARHPPGRPAIRHHAQHRAQVAAALPGPGLQLSVPASRDQLYFNLLRGSSNKGGATPEQLRLARAPKVSPQIHFLPPVMLSSISAHELLLPRQVLLGTTYLNCSSLSRASLPAGSRGRQLASQAVAIPRRAEQRFQRR